MSIPGKIYSDGPYFSVIGSLTGYELRVRRWSGGQYIYFVLEVSDYLYTARNRCKRLNKAMEISG